MEALPDIFCGEADFGSDLIRGDRDGHITAGCEAFNGPCDDFACDFFGIFDIGMVMIVGIMLCTGQPGGIACRYDRRACAACYIHDGRENILYIGDPEVEGTGTEHELCTDCVGKRDDAFVAVHGREAGAADAVELNAFCSVFPGEIEEFFRMAQAYDLTYECGQMTMDGDIHIAFFECAHIDFGGCAMTDAEECIRGDIRGHDAREAEGQTAAQELLHDAFPVAIRADTGAMIGIEYFVIGTDRQDVELLPDLLALLWCQRLDGLVFSRNGTREVIEQYVRQFAGQPLRALAACPHAESLADLTDAGRADERKVEAALRREFQGKEDFPGMGAVLGYTACGTSEEIPGHDEVGIGAADAARAFRRDLAGPHIADLAADAGKPE